MPAPQSIIAWLRANPEHRINTGDLRRYGYGGDARENRTLFLQVGSASGRSVDLVANEAISEGIIPPPPRDWNPADWFMHHVRENKPTAEGDIARKLEAERRYWESREFPAPEIDLSDPLLSRLHLENRGLSAGDASAALGEELRRLAEPNHAGGVVLTFDRIAQGEEVEYLYALGFYEVFPGIYQHDGGNPPEPEQEPEHYRDGHQLALF